MGPGGGALVRVPVDADLSRRVDHRPDRAARMEVAAGRRVARVGCVPFEHALLAQARLPQPGHGVEQRARVRVLRVRDDGLGRPDLDDAPEVHHREHVAHVADGREVVRDEHHRVPEPLLQVAHEVQHGALDGHVERRGDLVRDQHLRPARERPRDRHALPLAAGETARQLAGEVGVEVDEVEVLAAPPRRGRRARSRPGRPAPRTASRRPSSAGSATRTGPGRSPARDGGDRSRGRSARRARARRRGARRPQRAGRARRARGRASTCPSPTRRRGRPSSAPGRRGRRGRRPSGAAVRVRSGR